VTTGGAGITVGGAMWVVLVVVLAGVVLVMTMTSVGGGARLRDARRVAAVTGKKEGKTRRREK